VSPTVTLHFTQKLLIITFAIIVSPIRLLLKKSCTGIYVIRTSVSASRLKAPEVVLAYKSLSQVEQAFRSYKTVDLQVRPIFHHLADRVKAHIFLCMLAYYVEWHLRLALAPLIFDEDAPQQALAQRASVVEKAPRSDSAIRKIKRKQTIEELPVHSFQSLLADGSYCGQKSHSASPRNCQCF
jgi:transposase